MEEIVLYKILITGLVQGVGFRWSASKEAGRRGIKGYVKNQPDGSVYIEAEGSREELDAYVDWCRKGPGRVRSVNVNRFPPVDYTDFEIKH
mgnify:CR=1 FL=1